LQQCLAFQSSIRCRKDFNGCIRIYVDMFQIVLKNLRKGPGRDSLENGDLSEAPEHLIELMRLNKLRMGLAPGALGRHHCHHRWVRTTADRPRHLTSIWTAGLMRSIKCATWLFSVMAGALSARSSHIPRSSRFQLRGATRCEIVATKLQGCNQKTLACLTADDGRQGVVVL